MTARQEIILIFYGAKNNVFHLVTASDSNLTCWLKSISLFSGFNGVKNQVNVSQCHFSDDSLRAAHKREKDESFLGPKPLRGGGGLRDQQ